MRPIDPALLRRLPGLKAGLAASGVLAAATAIAIVAQAACLSTVLAGAVLPDYDAPWWALAGFVAVLLIRALLSWWSRWIASRTATTVKSGLRAQLVAALSRREGGGGEAVTLVTRGIDALDGYLTDYLPQLFAAACVPVSILAVFAFTDLSSLVIVVVTIPLIPIFGVLIGWHTESQTRQQWRTLARLGGHFLDMLSGLSTLRVFGRAAAGAQQVRETAERHRSATMATLKVAFLSALVLELVATVSVALIAVPIGLRLLDGGIHLSTAFLILLLAPEVYLPLRAVGSSFHAAQEGLAAARDAFAVIDDAAPQARTERSISPMPRSQFGEIRCDSVSLAYPEAEPVLTGVDLRVRQGTTVALTGPSGGGKSTLLAALLGFLPPRAGTISCGGRDLSTVEVDSWLRHIAWVPQRPHLFAMSVADNIRLGLPEASDAQVRAAAEAAHAAEFLDELPQGLDTALGEEGFGLSAGQRRRIALARAFLRLRLLDCPLVLLDEPTASLDVHSEELVASATRQLLRGRTAVIVAHRPALVDMADEVWRVSQSPSDSQRAVSRV